MIENQRSLIEDLARSNQDYIRKFESLKLGIEDKPRAQEGGSQKDEFSKEMDLDLQERPQVSSQGTEPRKRRTPQEAHTPYMNTGDFILSTSAQDMPMTPELEDTKPRQEIQENGPVEADLFSHVKHYLSLVNNLLDEIDELKYDIRIDSRDRVKVDVLQAYKREINLLDTSNQHLWGLMAAKPIAPLVDSLQKHFHRAQQQQQSQPLIKHHQHEDKVRAANLQKSHVNHSNRAPAAPTTPFSFGGQSPQGVPQVYVPRKNELAQGKLVLPATKKRTRDLGKTYPVNQRDQETSAEFAMSPELVRDLPDTRLDHDAEDNAEAVSSLVDFARHSPPRTTRIQTVVEADDIAATAHHSQGRTNLLRHSRCPLVTIDKERRGNGCLTCRKRQTLCDEGLPICQKCIQSGSRCEAGGSADEGEARDRPFSHLSHTSLHTSGSGLHGHGSAEEGYKSSSPPARVDRASTGGLLEPSLARTQADFKPRTKRLRSYDGRSEGQGEQFQSDASGEENRNSHRRPRRPSLLFSEWQPPPGQTPPPSSPSLRNKVSPAIPSSSLSEGFSRPTLVGSRVARDSASRKSVSDPEAGRQTVLDSWKSVDFSSNFQPDLRLDSTKAFDDYDPDYANRRRNIVDDLIGLWTLLPVDRANI